MPRNGSGTYSIPNTFLPNTSILSSLANGNFSDIATAMTGSLPRDGQAGMTGALIGIAGTATAPAFKFAGSTQSGFYRSAADQISVSTAGVERVRVKADGTLRGASDALLWAQLGASTDVQAMLSAADNAAIRTLLDVMTTAAVAAAVDAVKTPPGAMMWWPKNTPPSGWFERNGQAVSRTTYADLFAVIGTDYGAGDGWGTFNLPDDRAQFIRGWDNSAGIDTGRVFGSLQADEFKAHTHADYDLFSTAAPASGGRTSTATQSGTTGSTGGTETRPKNRAYLPIIKY